jgi:hypothetical protein
MRKLLWGIVFALAACASPTAPRVSTAHDPLPTNCVLTGQCVVPVDSLP